MARDLYKGFSLERNAEGYTEATPIDIPWSLDNIIPFRNMEDAKRGIDILWEKHTPNHPSPNGIPNWNL